MSSNLEKGNYFYKAKNFEKAIAYYSLALIEEPNLSRTLAFNIFISRNRLKYSDPDNEIFKAFRNTDFLLNEKIKFDPTVIFDYQFYLDNNPDIKQSGIDPQLHYYQFGESENRWPNNFFDPSFYRRTHKDVIEYNGSLFEHYIRFGAKEKRQIRAVRNHSHSLRNGKTILLISHDTEVGGAQQVVKLFAKWILSSTSYNIQIISVESGNLRHTFEEIAPCFVLSDYQRDDRKKAVKEWLSSNISACFMNSIASVEALNYLDHNMPLISFIHEMPKILNFHQDSIELLRINHVRILAGSVEVGKAFTDKYNFDPSQVYNCVSFIEPLPKQESDTRRKDSRESLRISDERFLIFGCGVIHWRKSPKTFIKVAEKVILMNDNVDFVWLGGGPDQENCEELVRAKGLEDRIRFTGYEPNISDKLAGGDLFLLTSEEDPFPLVALYAAQAGMPIVCFKNAGGIEGFVKAGSGISIEFMNVEMMAEAVIHYVTHPERCVNDGQKGKNQVALSHTVNAVAPTLMHHIREVAKLRPTISVIVPNYNYELYLEERLQSIANQTFQDFEVILLDDCSSDNSIDILEDFALRRPGTQIVINETNSGSPFAQWIRGMRQAHSDLIWLAEADDRCAHNLLEQMLPIFGDRNIFIASCGSRPITSDGNVIGDYRELYLNRISPGRWDKDYVTTDHEEINNGLGIANSIPNASAVVFRKFAPDSQFENEVTSMRLCGDWYFYLRAMQGGLFAYKSSVMNDHRRHGKTITNNLEGSHCYFDELATVRSYICRTFRQSSNALMKVETFLQDDINRFNVTNMRELPLTVSSKKLLPTLLIVAPDLSPGGGQVFAISLANEWVLRGGRCLILNVDNQQSHPEIIKQISDRVVYFNLKEKSCKLKVLIQEFDIDVIHSCIWWADCWVYNNRNDLPRDMPWIITMHGCHETILHNPSIDQTFFEKMNWMVKRAKWVYTANKNLEVFGLIKRPTELVKIANGTKEQTLITQLSRRDLGLREDSVVLCLASRAIKSKGWFESVRLVERLEREGHNVELLLIGEGPAADSLRDKVPKNVFLISQVANLHDYLNLCDIGILPSYFEGESFPLILLEMMCNSLPIVASDIGEIPRMIGEGPDSSGFVISQKNSSIDEEEFYKASLKLLDKNVRAAYANNARLRYSEKFSIKKMVDAYCALYHN